MEKENIKKGKKKKWKKLLIKENKRNNSNSISCNNCSFVNISWDNNKFSV